MPVGGIQRQRGDQWPCHFCELRSAPVSKAKGRTRQERHVVDIAVGMENPPENRYPPGETYEEVKKFPVAGHAKGHEGQVVQRSIRAQPTGQLTDFAIMLQIRQSEAETWEDVVRVDRAHGEVHIDRYRHDGTHAKDGDSVPPQCRDSLDAALTWATSYVWDLEGRYSEWAK
jgi:hypothetical protein